MSNVNVENILKVIRKDCIPEPLHFYRLKLEFINNLACRYESNQHKARKIWNELKVKLNFSEDKIREVETEWNHWENEYNPDIGIWMEYFKKQIGLK